jgi:hydroxymethylpyrimidine/phosphomethylpyrimidine kinase
MRPEEAPICSFVERFLGDRPDKAAGEPHTRRPRTNRRISSPRMTPSRIPRVLSIAGSDSGGGAGIQADIKAFARCGVHGMTAITAVTWQNTVAVEGVTPIPPEAIVGQVRVVVEDIGVDAVKIGMLGTIATIAAVSEALDLVGEAPVVLDPVMIAESGAHLLEPDAREALVRLLPRATVVTPNLGEARALVEAAGRAAPDDPGELSRAVAALGPRHVVVTGGHGSGAEAVDFFFDGERVERIRGPMFPGGAAHGSGCTHSSALAAHLALGAEPLEAAREAKRIAAEAVREGLGEIGSGPGPVDVFGLRAHGAARRP